MAGPFVRITSFGSILWISLLLFGCSSLSQDRGYGCKVETGFSCIRLNGVAFGIADGMSVSAKSDWHYGLSARVLDRNGHDVVVLHWTYASTIKPRFSGSKIEREEFGRKYIFSSKNGVEFPSEVVFPVARLSGGNDSIAVDCWVEDPPQEWDSERKSLHASMAGKILKSLQQLNSGLESW